MSEFITDRFSDLLVRVVTVQGITSLLLLTGVLWFVKKAFFPSGYVATLAGPRAWPFPLCVITYFRAVSRHGGVHSLQQSFYHQYGKICRMLSPTGSDKILVADPEIIKQILVKEFHRFPERGMPIKLVSPLDSELFMSEYSRWKRLRRVLSPTFSAARLKEIVPLVSEACDRLETKIGRLAATGDDEITYHDIGSNLIWENNRSNYVTSDFKKKVMHLLLHLLVSCMPSLLRRQAESYNLVTLGKYEADENNEGSMMTNDSEPSLSSLASFLPILAKKKQSLPVEEAYVCLFVSLWN